MQDALANGGFSAESISHLPDMTDSVTKADYVLIGIDCSRSGRLMPPVIQDSADALPSDPVIPILLIYRHFVVRLSGTGTADGHTEAQIECYSRIISHALTPEPGPLTDAPIYDRYELLDLTILNKLQNAMSRRSFRKILETHANTNSDQIASIHCLIHEKKYKDILWQTHNLKSTSGGLGAVALHRVACEIESAIRTHHEDKLERLGQKLLRVSHASIEFLCHTFDIPTSEQLAVSKASPESTP